MAWPFTQEWRSKRLAKKAEKDRDKIEKIKKQSRETTKDLMQSIDRMQKQAQAAMHPEEPNDKPKANQ